MISILVRMFFLFRRMDSRHMLKRSKCLVAVGINTRTNACSFRCTGRSVGVVKVYDSTTHRCQSLAEERAEEHIGMTGMDIRDVGSHLTHHINTLLERKDDTFLGST